MDELTHHGIKGQKWGVRRTPAQLGYKTSSKRPKKKQASVVDRWKKQRLAKKAEQIKEKEEKEARTKAMARTNKLRKMDVKDMTDDEINERLNRVKKEEEVVRLDANIRRLTPDNTSAGKKFLQKMSKDVVGPAITEAGKDLLTRYLKKAGGKLLGLDSTGVNKLIDTAKDATKDTREAAEKAAEEAKQETAKADTGSKTGVRGKKWETKSDSEKVYAPSKIWTPKNTDSGESYASSSSKVYVSDFTVDNVSSGRSYVSNLLALPAPKRSALPAPKDDD